MPTLWTYSDPSDRGFGLFKRRILNELRATGWETRLAVAPLLEEESKKILREDFLRHPADWVLLINQSAAQFYDYLKIPSEQRSASCKKIVWYLDNPQFFVNQPFDVEDYVYCFDETYLDWLKPLCPNPPGFMPLAADQSQQGTFNPKFACDVSFVGGVINQTLRRNQLQPDMTRYIQSLVGKKLIQRSKTMEELAALYPIAEGKRITINADVAHYLYWEANNFYRIQTLEALLDYDLRIYGNEDWEILLQGSPLFERYKGKADPNTELPDIFASSKINLNIHSIQCQGSLNQRDFNAPLCGGFLLSDWVPAAGRYFHPGTEAVYYSDIDNLRRKIDYYLPREDERKVVIEAGKQRVQLYHTYKNRIVDLLQTLPV